MFEFFRKQRGFRDDREKVFRLLDDYPEYIPPHRGKLDSDIRWTRSQAKENFAYFLSEKENRIRYLRDYINNFGLKLRFTDEGLKEFSFWFHRYNGHFEYERVQGKLNSVESWHIFNPEWRAGLRYLNLILDISIYIGEHIVNFNPESEWKLKVGRNTKGNNQDGTFFREYVSGSIHYENGDRHDFCPRQWIDAACMERYAVFYYRKYVGDTWSFWNDPASLHRWVRFIANPNKGIVDPWHPDGDIASMKFPASGPSKEQQAFLNLVMAEENRYWAARDEEVLRHSGETK